MPVVDLSSYHQNPGTTSDGTKFNNLIDAVQAALNGIDHNNIAGAAGILGSQLAAAAGIVAAQLTIPYSSYTPTWGATGVAPALGNGVSQGRYVQVGKLVHFMMDFNPGSTSTFGTGNYTFSLPVTASVAMQGAPLGSIYAEDLSASAFSMAFPILASSTTFNMQYVATWPTGVQALYGQTAPWTWATGDTIWVCGTYEAA